MREKFIDWRPHTQTAYLLDKVRRIVGDEGDVNEGMDAWTLRQLHSRLIDDYAIEGGGRSYDRLAEMLATARLAGVLDWDAISDGPSRHLGDLTLGLPEVWIEREVVALQVHAALEPWGFPVVFLRGAPSVDMVYRLHKRNVPIIHFAEPESSIDFYARLEVFGGPRELVSRSDESLDELVPDALREFVADTAELVFGPPTGELAPVPHPTAGYVDDIREAMAITADTTRASALKKKIEAILNG